MEHMKVIWGVGIRWSKESQRFGELGDNKDFQFGMSGGELYSEGESIFAISAGEQICDSEARGKNSEFKFLGNHWVAKKAKRFEGRGCLRASEAYIRDGGRCDKSAYRYLALLAREGQKDWDLESKKRVKRGNYVQLQ